MAAPSNPQVRKYCYRCASVMICAENVVKIDAPASSFCTVWKRWTNVHKLITPYSLNWEFVNSQNKVSDVFDLNMRRICGGKEWIF